MSEGIVRLQAGTNKYDSQKVSQSQDYGNQKTQYSSVFPKNSGYYPKMRKNSSISQKKYQFFGKFRKMTLFF